MPSLTTRNSLLLLWFLLLYYPAASETVAAGPETIAIAVDEFVPGAKVVVQYGRIPSYPGLCQYWKAPTNSGSISVECSYHVSDTLAETRETLTSILFGQNERIDPMTFGDLAYGGYGRLLFVQGTAVCDLYVGVPETLQQTYPPETLARELALAVQAKMESAGHFKAPPLVVTKTVVSNTANDIRLRLTSELPPEYLPLKHRLRVYVAGCHQPVYREILEDSSGDVTIDWNEIVQNGGLLPEDSYSLSVSSADVLGRTQYTRHETWGPSASDASPFGGRQWIAILVAVMTLLFCLELPRIASRLRAGS